MSENTAQAEQPAANTQQDQAAQPQRAVGPFEFLLQLAKDHVATLPPSSQLALNTVLPGVVGDLDAELARGRQSAQDNKALQKRVAELEAEVERLKAAHAAACSGRVVEMKPLPGSPTGTPTRIAAGGKRRKKA